MIVAELITTLFSGRLLTSTGVVMSWPNRSKPWVNWLMGVLATPVQFYVGWQYYIGAFKSLRNGSAKPLRVILGEPPDNELLLSAERVPEQQAPGGLLGVTIIELSSQVRQLLKIPRHVQGAVVLDLHAYSAAAHAGLRPGDVVESINRQEVGNASDVWRLTQNAKDRRALLRVWSNGASHFILVENKPWP